MKPVQTGPGAAKQMWLPTMSPGLLKVAERAKRDPEARFTSLAHLLDPEALKRAYRRLETKAAAGVDDITKEMYGQALEENIRNLHGRLRRKQYRHQPIRRVQIPKGKGKTRSIGISTVEDKIVQGAVTEVLGTIYEQDFLHCSYGFRPGRSAHDALRALNQMVYREGVQWILEADIEAFFDSVDRSKLREMLQKRVIDGSLTRLVGKCLRVGVLDGEQFSRPDEGTVQGSIISPLLGNVYLHYVLDTWFENEVRPRMRGHARLIRYADDFVMGFASKDDAERVWKALHARMAEFGLTLHPDKTRLFPFRRPAGPNGRVRRETFDFLGFTVHWRRARRGGWALGMKTRMASLRKASQAFSDYCRRHRHTPLEEQHAALTVRLRGHYQYFGVNGNSRSMGKLLYQVKLVWWKWLKRRSQSGRYPWKRFAKYLDAFPLPAPRIRVQIWGASP